MPTPYINLAKLTDLLGPATLAEIAANSTARIEAVIDSQCAVADGYVSAQVSLPPTAQAIEQVAPIVSELVYCILYANDRSDAVEARRKAALQQLKDIASGLVRLHVEPVVDDPSTPEDESATGAAAGSAGRLASRSALGGRGSYEAW